MLTTRRKTYPSSGSGNPSCCRLCGLVQLGTLHTVKICSRRQKNNCAPHARQPRLCVCERPWVKVAHCAPSIITRTRLCCYITFQCDIARDWKAICVHNMAAKRKQGLLDHFFTVVSKMPKGKCSTFWHFNSITSWLKGSFSRQKTTFKRVIEPERPLPGSTVGKICQKLVELSLTAGYPGTSQLLVISEYGCEEKVGFAE